MRYAVILAGGGGTRLWPASRSTRPKQFLPLGPDGISLLRATWQRLAAIVGDDHVVVVAGQSHAELVRADLPELAPDLLLLEPVARNTAPAIAFAAGVIAARDSEASIGVFPADHDVGDDAAFRSTVETAFAAAEDGSGLVIVGVRPTTPETGFGYIHVAGTAPVHSVNAFVEKPDAETAQRYLDAGDYLWNAGLVFGTARAIVDAVSALAPAVAAAAMPGANGSPPAYADSPSISFDYAVLERSGDVRAVAGDFGWNDVGSWAAVGAHMPADDRDNHVSGRGVVCDGSRNLILSDGGAAIAVVGLDDIAVIHSGKGILVVPKSRAQDVRDAVDALRAAKLDEHL